MTGVTRSAHLYCFRYEFKTFECCSFLILGKFNLYRKQEKYYEFIIYMYFNTTVDLRRSNANIWKAIIN